jgi:hypothetical protein
VSTTGDGGVVIVSLSDEARQGLAISPVSVKLTGLTAAQIEQVGVGSYLVNAGSVCSDCHTVPGQKFLSGGLTIPLGPIPGFDGGATGPFVVSRNLTPDPASGLKDSLAQYIQAERNGTDIENVGASLIVHPWQYHRWMTTDDLTAIYSYLTAIPPVANPDKPDDKPALPSISFPSDYNEGAVNRVLPPETDGMGNPVPDPDNVQRGLAIMPLDVPLPPDAPTLALVGRGSYLVNAVVGCSSCHTNPDRNYMTPNAQINTAQYMAGGRVFPTGPAASQVGVTRSMSANLIGQKNGFFNQADVSFETFLTTITQGVHADEMNEAGVAPPLAYPMPWYAFKNMNLADLEAIYTYLSWLAQSPAAPSGGNDKVTQSAARYCTAATASTVCTRPGEKCDTTNNECVGYACTVATAATDCDACQDCTAGQCAAPSSAAALTCVGNGI